MKEHESRGDLMIRYGIKDVSGGTYADGFFDCLRFMDEKLKCLDVRELLKIKQDAKKTK